MFCVEPFVDLFPAHQSITLGRQDTFGHQILQCHIDLTQSPSRLKLEAMCRPPSEQVAWPTPQAQQVHPLLTSRDGLPYVDPQGWHYSPWWLLTNDEDDTGVVRIFCLWGGIPLGQNSRPKPRAGWGSRGQARGL